jgi:hypothetical protein
MLEIFLVAVAVVGSIVTSVFGYLKYRAYLDMARHVVDNLGVEGLRNFSALDPPEHAVQRFPHRGLARGTGTFVKAAQRQPGLDG